MNFSSQNGVIWCIANENDSYLRYLEVPLKGKNKTLVKILGGQHRTTPAGQILGVATPAALTPMGASRLGEDALYKLAFYITVQPKPTVIGRRSMHSRGKMFATDSVGATTAEKLDGTSRGAVDGDFLPFPHSLPSPLLLHPCFTHSFHTLLSFSPWS